MNVITWKNNFYSFKRNAHNVEYVDEWINKNVIFLKETKMKSQNKIIEISGKSLRGIYLDKNKIISRKIEWMRPKFTILSYKSIGYYER